MKILICDYDNTLDVHYDYLKLPYENSLEKNLKAISKFNKNNNIFVLATGRYFSSIKESIDENHIKFDYLCCNNGAELYDKNYNLMFFEELNSDDLEYIRQMEKDIQIPIKYRYSNNNINLIAASIYFDNYDSYNIVKNKLDKNIKESVIEYKYPKIKIIPKSADKIKCMDIILKKINVEDIYAIGDDINDYGIIKKYNGYTLPWANDEIKKVSRKIYNNVYNLIDELMGE